MGCETCARRAHCPFYKLVKQPCPHYVPDPFACWVRGIAPVWYEVVKGE